MTGVPFTSQPVIQAFFRSFIQTVDIKSCCGPKRIAFAVDTASDIIILVRKTSWSIPKPSDILLIELFMSHLPLLSFIRITQNAADLGHIFNILQSRNSKFGITFIRVIMSRYNPTRIDDSPF
ncbi:hypothetical protein D3C73_870790 [compost metagenome]